MQLSGSQIRMLDNMVVGQYTTHIRMRRTGSTTVVKYFLDMFDSTYLLCYEGMWEKSPHIIRSPNEIRGMRGGIETLIIDQPYKVTTAMECIEMARICNRDCNIHIIEMSGGNHIYERIRLPFEIFEY